MKLTKKQDTEFRIQLMKLNDLTEQMNQIWSWLDQGLITQRKCNDYKFSIQIWDQQKHKKAAE